MSTKPKKEPHHIVMELQQAQLAGLIMWYHTTTQKNIPEGEEYSPFCIVKFKEDTTEATKRRIQEYIIATYKDLSPITTPQENDILWINRKVPQDPPV